MNQHVSKLANTSFGNISSSGIVNASKVGVNVVNPTDRLEVDGSIKLVGTGNLKKTTTAGSTDNPLFDFRNTDGNGMRFEIGDSNTHGATIDLKSVDNGTARDLMSIKPEGMISLGQQANLDIKTDPTAGVSQALALDFGDATGWHTRIKANGTEFIDIMDDKTINIKNGATLNIAADSSLVNNGSTTLSGTTTLGSLTTKANIYHWSMFNPTADKVRWAVAVDGAELGLATGSNFQLTSWADDGSAIGTALTVRRSDGHVGILKDAGIEAVEVSGTIKSDALKVATSTAVDTQLVKIGYSDKGTYFSDGTVDIIGRSDGVYSIDRNGTKCVLNVYGDDDYTTTSSCAIGIGARAIMPGGNTVRHTFARIVGSNRDGDDYDGKLLLQCLYGGSFVNRINMTYAGVLIGQQDPSKEATEALEVNGSILSNASLKLKTGAFTTAFTPATITANRTITIPDKNIDLDNPIINTLTTTGAIISGGDITGGGNISSNNDSSHGYILRLSNSTEKGSFGYSAGLGGYFTNAVADDVCIRNKTPNASVRIGVEEGASTFNVMNGKVGINTTPTAEALEVNGNISLVGQVKTYNGPSPHYAMFTNTKRRWDIGMAYLDPDNGSNTGSRFIIYRYDDAGNDTTAMAIDRGMGYVGINTDTPTQMLDVIGNIKTTGIVAPAASDLSISTDAGKTMVLAQPVYDDLNLDITPRNTGTGRPTLAPFGDLLINLYQFAINDFSDFTPVEIKHDWKEGTQLEFHIHYAFSSDNDATERKVKFELSYTYADSVAGASFSSLATIPAEATIAANEAGYKHKYLTLATVTPATKIGTQFLFRLKRIAASSSEVLYDPFLFNFGIHYMVDTMGSRTISAK
jgi:hypothetical protein